MEFIQSRFQDVFSRFYEMICHIFWYVILALILSFFFSTEVNYFSYIVIFLVFTVCSILYLFFIHRNTSKVIRISDDKFYYRNINTVTEFSWDDYQGYEIYKTIPYQVIIKNRVYCDIRFSYYAFSPEQRKQIFNVLHNKSANKTQQEDSR